jgi:ppGpp synthetase/RelA/SpoT-type nucleotidyltranferase
MNRVEYLKFRQPYERIVRQLLLELEFFQEDFIGVNIHSITSRLKTFESAFEKAQRLKRAISELQDIAGIRVVVATLDEVNIVCRFFSKKAGFKDLTIKSNEVITKKDGYRARHLVLEFKGHYSRSVYSTLVEVQVLTLLQHTFNYISRAWVYKTELSFSDSWRISFKKLSQELADMDKQIVQLQNEVIEISALAGDNEPLTPFSYQRIIADMFGESETVDNAVDDVRILINVGFNTNGQLREFFSNSDILNLREQFLKLESVIGKAFTKKYIASMAIHRFFLQYGLYLDSSRDFLQELSVDDGEVE